jgi:hypothetical protein
MSILLLLLLAVVVLVVLAVVVLLAVAAFQPSAFRVRRSLQVAAPPSAVFPHVNDLTRWDSWSPWEKMDPRMRKTFEGPSAGPGAICNWDGDRRVGTGRTLIVENTPPDRVGIRLEMLRPFKGTNSVEFTFVPKDGGTVVTWTMDGTLNLVTKAAHLVIGMDRMIGGQFERGLAALKRVAESSPAR